MPRAWLLHPQRHCGRMPAQPPQPPPPKSTTTTTTELTIMRSDNPSHEHGKFNKEITSKNKLPSLYRQRRIVSTNGKIKVTTANIPQKHRRFYGDLFTTTLDLPFHWITLVYAVVYLVSWSGFGTLWWLIYIIRKNQGYDQYYCVENVDSWTTAFLFSIETQTTIGYGGRQVTANCPEGVVILLIQTLIGSFIAATLLGIVFAKASRPKKRSHTVMFSEKAVVGKRNNNLCLMFRVGDLRKSQLLECHMQMELYYTRQTSEGEIPYFQERLPLGNGFTESSDTYYTFLLLPNVIVHVIDEQSPLYDMTRADMLDANVEVVVILEGVVECTGLTMQARTSYTANEIVWGYNFVNLPKNRSSTGEDQLVLDYSYFDHVKPVENMPLCSAKLYQQSQKERFLKTNGSLQVFEKKIVESGESDGGSSSQLHEVSLDTTESCEVIPNDLVASEQSEEEQDSEKTKKGLCQTNC